MFGSDLPDNLLGIPVVVQTLGSDVCCSERLGSFCYFLKGAQLLLYMLVKTIAPNNPEAHVAALQVVS